MATLGMESPPPQGGPLLHKSQREEGGQCCPPGPGLGVGQLLSAQGAPTMGLGCRNRRGRRGVVGEGTHQAALGSPLHRAFLAAPASCPRDTPLAQVEARGPGRGLPLAAPRPPASLQGRGCCHPLLWLLGTDGVDSL